MRGAGRSLFVLLAGIGLLGLLPGCNDDSTPSTPSTPAPLPTAAPVPTPTAPPTTPTTTAPVALVVKLNPTPAEGDAPFTLEVNLCQSRPVPPVDGFPLTFTLTYGDGARHVETFCRDKHTYQNPGAFRASFCATDGVAGHESCKGANVTVN